jgi:transcriptional regulator with XRE-family HTH domain
MASELGSRLKASRTGKGLSLRSVAAEIGVSAALISQIELGHTQPSVSTLYALVNFLGISLDQVMGLPAATQPVPVPAHHAPHPTGAPDAETARPLRHHSPGDRPTLEIGNGVRWELVASAPGSSAEAVLVTYEPGASSSSDGSLMTHAGTEDAYLVAGELTLELEDSVVMLRAGDSFGFDSARPHRFRNTGTAPASGIWLKARGEA